MKRRGKSHHPYRGAIPLPPFPPFTHALDPDFYLDSFGLTCTHSGRFGYLDLFGTIRGYLVRSCGPVLGDWILIWLYLA